MSSEQPTAKRCVMCGEDKQVESFARDSNRKDGLYVYCRQCVAEERRRPRPPIADHKRCPACGETKPRKEFGTRKGRNGKPKSAANCRACAAEKQRLLRRADPAARARMNERRTPTKASARRAADAARRVKGSKQWARRKVQDAVKRGHMVKPTACEHCNTAVPRHQLHGHHWHGDYTNRPLEVEWLCSLCHGAEHSQRSDHARPAGESTS